MSEDGRNFHALTHNSKLYHIDRLYPSMQGPYEYVPVSIWNSSEGELLWIRGLKQEIFDDKGEPYPSTENYCHGHFLFDYEDDGAFKARTFRMGNASHRNGRLFTLMQGRSEIVFPNGFGIPVHSQEPFSIGSMLQNYDRDAEPRDLMIKTTVFFERQVELNTAMRPLYLHHIGIRLPVIDESVGILHETIQKEKIDLVGDQGEDKKSHFLCYSADPEGNLKAADGLTYSGYWFVPPGRHEYRYQLEAGNRFAYDSTVHYIATHLHAYGVSLELVDKTAQKSIFKSFAEQYEKKRGISHLDYYSSEEGISVYKDHEYELIAVIDNPMEEPVDMMATMYLFIEDKNFDITQVKLR